MAKAELPVRDIRVLEIRCSAPRCKVNLREDAKNDRDGYDNQEHHFRQAAVAKKWVAAKTIEGYILSFCEDHARLAEDFE